jgi:hypothetical protein
VTIGTHYSPVLALLQSLANATSGGTAAPIPGASAPPATPEQAVLLGPAATGSDLTLGQTVDTLA